MQNKHKNWKKKKSIYTIIICLAENKKYTWRPHVASQGQNVQY
jgi:hypothetical protein